MAAGKRPGGLTALAVLNFIFGGMGVLGALVLVPLFALLGAMADEIEDEALKQQLDAVNDMGAAMLAILVGLSFINSLALVLCGFGCLKQKKFLGRTMGNLYVLTGLIYIVFQTTAMPPVMGGGFGFQTIIGLIYPVLILFFLNVTFKEDLVN